MQCINREQIARVAYKAAKVYHPAMMPAWEDVALLIGTAAAETGLTRGSTKTGLGLWNIDLHHAMFVFETYLHHRWWHRKRKIPWQLFQEAWQGTTSQRVFIPSQKDLRHLLVMDDEFACAMVGWMYMDKPEVPENLSELANYWYRYYPQEKPGKQIDFMNAWDQCHCDSMMGDLGYG